MRTSVHILLVEDNPDHTELILRHFERLGSYFTLTHVVDGQEVLDELAQRAGDPHNPMPDLVLLDLRIPKVDGLTVLETMRDVYGESAPPVIVLSSSTSDRDIQTSFANLADMYIFKPIEFQELCHALDSFGLLPASIA